MYNLHEQDAEFAGWSTSADWLGWRLEEWAGGALISGRSLRNFALHEFQAIAEWVEDVGMRGIAGPGRDAEVPSAQAGCQKHQHCQQKQYGDLQGSSFHRMARGLECVCDDLVT